MLNIIISIAYWFYFNDEPTLMKNVYSMQAKGYKLRYISRALNAASFEINSNELIRFNSVDSIKPVRILKTYLEEENKGFNINTHDTSYFAASLTQLSIIGADSAQILGYTGNGVIVGIIDTGLKKDHLAISSVKLLKEHDFLAKDELKIADEPSVTVGSFSSISYLSSIEDTNLKAISFITDIDTSTFSNDRRTLAFMPYNNNFFGPYYIDLNYVSSYTLFSQGKETFVILSGGEEYYKNSLYYARIGTNYSSSPTSLQLKGKNPDIIKISDSLFLTYTRNDSLFLATLFITDNDELKTNKERLITNGIWRGGKPCIVKEKDTVHILFPSIDSILVFNVYSNNLSSIPTKALEIKSKLINETNYIVIADKNLLTLATFTGNIKKIETYSFEYPLHVFIGNKEGNPLLLFTSNNNLYSIFKNTVKKYEDYSNFGIFFNNSIFYTLKGDDNTDYEEDEDYSEQPFHGTEMTGLIAGNVPHTFMGVSPSVSIIMAKTEKVRTKIGKYYETELEEDTYIAGIEWLVKNGVHIISSSLAYSEWYNYSDMDGKTSPVSRVVDWAKGKGVLVVTAMGNVTSQAPYLLTPADAQGALSVGGINKDSTWWSSQSGVGSAIGPTYDGRTKPDLVALSSYVRIPYPKDNISFAYSNGTSHATALISGLAALCLEIHPEWRLHPDTLIAALKFSASNNKAPNDTIGWGIPNFMNILREYPTQIKNEERNILFTPYPNPATKDTVYFPFYLYSGGSVRIKIFNMKGKLIKDIFLKNQDILAPGEYIERTQLTQIGSYLCIKELPAGIYIVALQSQSGNNSLTKFTIVK